MTTLDRGKADVDLAGSLARVLRRLHAGRYERLAGELWRALLDASDTFEGTLAAHLEEEEERVFPALQEAAPERAPEIEALRREHVDIRQRASDLMARVRDGDSALAIETGRELFALLANHAGRERAVIAEVLRSLSPARLRRVTRTLKEKGDSP